MGDYLSIMQDAGDQALDLTKRAQETALSAVGTVSEVAGEIVPDIHDSLPLVGRLPAPKDVAATSFEIAGKFFEAGRDYTLALFDAASPVTDKLLPKPKTRKGAAKTTKRTAA